MEGREWFHSRWFLIMRGVIQSPFWHLYLPLNCVRYGLMAALYRAGCIADNWETKSPLLGGTAGLLPRPEALLGVSAPDGVHTPLEPVGLGRLRPSGVPVRILATPLPPTHLKRKQNVDLNLLFFVNINQIKLPKARHGVCLHEAQTKYYFCNITIGAPRVSCPAITDQTMLLKTMT